MTQNQIAFHNALELERHNKATEEETSRHQRMQEALQNVSNALTKWQIAVNNAHYTRQDYETMRANRMREQQNQASINENVRTNVANEAIRRQANAIQSASVAETSRHQRQMENIQSTYNAALIEKAAAETGYTRERTQSEGVYRTIVLPTQAQVNTSQAGLNTERTQTEYTNRWANVMSGFASGAHAIRDLGGTITDILQMGFGSGSQSTPTQTDQSRQFWKQLEVQVNK